MSNRLALAVVAVAVPVAGFFLSQNQFFKLADQGGGINPEKPEPRDFSPIENPEPEPEIEPVVPSRVRHDQALFDQFSGKSIPEIIAALNPEMPVSQPETQVGKSILDALPDAPFPFPTGSEPLDAVALEQFVSTTQQGSVADSTVLSRWKLNVAHVALGTYPDGVPEEFLIPNLLKSSTEQFPVRFNETEALNCGSVFAVADFNSDGQDDLIGQGGTLLWKSLSGDPVATRLTPADGLFPADFDGDGDVDLFATRRNGLPNSLWINEGGGTFIDFTVGAGLLAFADTTTAAWGDFNRDAKLDLAVGNADAPLEIYLSKGDGIFELDTEEKAAAEMTSVIQLNDLDLDNDGLPELIVTPADGPVVALCSPTMISGLSVSGSKDDVESILEFFDFDNDGDLDSLIAGENSINLFQNDGKGVFTDVSAELGLPEIADVRSLVVVDLDADGLEDFYVGTAAGYPNRAFWNRDGLAFREVTASSGLGFLSGSGIVATTTSGLLIDGKITRPEGDPSQLTVHLEKNSAGAKINILTRDSDWILQPIQRIANGYQPTVIGMGDAKVIESILVVWPDAGTPPSKFIGKDIPPHSIVAIERSADAVIVLDE